MAQYDYNTFIWNQDHDMSDRASADLKDFLNADSITGTYTLHEKWITLSAGQTLTITKNGFLIKVIMTSSEIFAEMDSITITGPAEIKEINFGYPLKYLFRYKEQILPFVKSYWATGLQNGPKRKKDGMDLQLQWVSAEAMSYNDTDSNVDSTPTYTTTSCFKVTSSDFTIYNNQDYCLTFLSWPGLTKPQATTMDPELREDDAVDPFFISDPPSNWGPLGKTGGALNWGTLHCPPMIGICSGEAEVGTWENNIFTYEKKEYLLPTNGSVIRIYREPAEDLKLPKAINNMVYSAYQARKNHNSNYSYQDINAILGKVPVLERWCTWNVDADHAKLNIGSTNSWPWCENQSIQDSASLYIFYYGQIDDYFFNYPENYPEYVPLQDMFKDQQWTCANFPQQLHYSADMFFSSVRFITLDNLLNQPDMTNQDAGISLLTNTEMPSILVKDVVVKHDFQQYAKTLNNRSQLIIKPSTAGYRNYIDWKWETTGYLPQIAITLHNFCLYPNEKIDKIMYFKQPEITCLNQRIFENIGHSDKAWKNEDMTYAACCLKLYWTGRLINKDTSEFLYPEEARINPRPSATITIDGKERAVEIFRDYGAWDLLLNRITSVSCLLFFKDETATLDETTNTLRFSFSLHRDDSERFLFNKTVSEADLNGRPPFFFWPSYSKETWSHIVQCTYDPRQFSGVYDFKFSKNPLRAFGGQDQSAVTMFVQPDVDANGFNTGASYGWYWIDESIRIVTNKHTNADGSIYFDYKIINYTSSNITHEDKIIPPLSYYQLIRVDNSKTIIINNKSTITIDQNTNNAEWAIFKDDSVLRNNEIYGIWTEEGIQPYA